MKAYSDVLTETSTEIAPWYVIPADNKWFMRYAVGRIICTRMEALDLHYPQLSKEELERLEECKRVYPTLISRSHQTLSFPVLTGYCFRDLTNAF